MDDCSAIEGGESSGDVASFETGGSMKEMSIASLATRTISSFSEALRDREWAAPGENSIRSHWWGSKDKEDRASKPDKNETRSRSEKNEKKDRPKNDGDWHMTALRDQPMDPTYREKGDEKMKEANRESLLVVRDGIAYIASQTVPGLGLVLRPVGPVDVLMHARDSVAAHEEAKALYEEGVRQEQERMVCERQEAERRAEEALTAQERERWEKEAQDINDKAIGISLGADQYR